MMPSATELAVLALAALILFKGKDIPRLLGDIGKGVSNFRRGLSAPDSATEPKG